MVSKQLLDRITINPDVMVGKPTIRGLRVKDYGGTNFDGFGGRSYSAITT